MNRAASAWSALGAGVAFEQLFSVPPQVQATATGRVNLIGEHTDYNEGYVLPAPLPYATQVLAARGDGFEGFAEVFNERLRREPDEGHRGDWMDYVVGCVQMLRLDGHRVPGAYMYIRSDVPVGAGLSSSAALEVAVLRALRGLYGLELDDLRLALVAHRAEVEFCGVRCGVMDQMVVSLGTPGQALFLDTRALAYELVSIPQGYRFVVVDTRVPRRLVEAGYNRRRAECEDAAARLGVRALRDITVDDLGRVAALPDPLSRRARHVVSENARVIGAVDALRSADMDAFGRLMIDSHRSLRDDFDVSVPELDTLVDLAMRHGALGARLTGAGFGGCTVALVPESQAEAWAAGVVRDYPTAAIYQRNVLHV